MRHYKKGRKLGTDASHTKAMKKSLAVALFTNDRIKTTVTRAKEMRGLVDRIVTWAKKGDLHSRRLAIAALGDKELVREVFAKAEQGMWADRNGGYTRILKLGPRKGDNAPMCILELVEEAVEKKAGTGEAKAADKGTKKRGGRRSAKKEKAPEEPADAAPAEDAAEEPAEAAEAETAEDAAAEAEPVEPETAEPAAAEPAEAADAAPAEEPAEDAETAEPTDEAPAEDTEPAAETPAAEPADAASAEDAESAKAADEEKAE